MSSKQFARINLITSVQSTTCNKAERWKNCKAVPVGVKGKLKSWNGHAVVEVQQNVGRYRDDENIFKVSA